jgi:uncharacterized membrane-anchored protein
MTTTLYSNRLALWWPSQPRQPDRLDVALEHERASPRWYLVVVRVVHSIIDNGDDVHRYRPNQKYNRRHDKSYHSTTRGMAASTARTNAVTKTTTRSIGTALTIGTKLEI